MKVAVIGAGGGGGYFGAQLQLAGNDVQFRAALGEVHFLIGLSATTSVTRTSIGVVRSHTASRALLLELMTETTTLGQHLGVDLPSSLPAERLEFCDGLPFDMTSSMANDLAGGRRLELDWLSGYVSRRSAEMGLDVPANRVVAAALSPFKDGSNADGVGHPG